MVDIRSIKSSGFCISARRITEYILQAEK